MNNYLIDIKDNENIVFENEEPIKIIDMRFCYISIDKNIGETFIVYGAHIENNSLISLAQKITITQEEFLKSNFANNAYVVIIDSENGALRSSDFIDTCNFLLFPNGSLTTDFVQQEENPNIIYGLTSKSDNKIGIFRFEIDKNMLMGVYTLYRCLNNLYMDTNAYKFINDWMAGKFIKDIMKNSTMKVVTGFELMDISRTMKLEHGKNKGIAVYKFNTISEYNEINNTDFVVLISFISTRPIRSRRKTKSSTELEIMYGKNAYKTNPFTAQSIDLENIFVFCTDKGDKNMLILRFNKDKFKEFQQSIIDIGNK